jgi:hypothetical protein
MRAPTSTASHMTDPDHGKFIMVLEEVRENVKAACGIDVSFTVLIGSRKKDAVWFKYSYHAIITNIGMQNNHDDMMKRLMEVGMEADGDDAARELSAYYYYDVGKGKHIHIVDNAVYTPNRQMRMLWSQCGAQSLGTTFLSKSWWVTDMLTISTALLFLTA